jgi:hypothetical protein
LLGSSLVLLLLWLSLFLLLGSSVGNYRSGGSIDIIIVVVVITPFVSETTVSVTGEMRTSWLPACGGWLG